MESSEKIEVQTDKGKHWCPYAEWLVHHEFQKMQHNALIDRMRRGLM